MARVAYEDSFTQDARVGRKGKRQGIKRLVMEEGNFFVSTKDKIIVIGCETMFIFVGVIL